MRCPNIARKYCALETTNDSSGTAAMALARISLTLQNKYSNGPQTHPTVRVSKPRCHDKQSYSPNFTGNFVKNFQYFQI